MTPKDTDNLKTVGQLLDRLCLLIAVNVFACYFIPFVLAYAGSYLNGFFIPDFLRWEDGHLRKDLTQLYRLSGLIVLVEWLGLLYGLYRFNKWYCNFLPYPQSLAVTVLATSLNSLLVSISTWNWFAYILPHI